MKNHTPLSTRKEPDNETTAGSEVSTDPPKNPSAHEQPDPVRRSVLKRIAATGVSAGSISALPSTVAAETRDDAVEREAPFVSVEVTVSKPDDAIVHSDDRPFPKTIETPSAMYLPLGFDAPAGAREHGPVIEDTHSVRFSQPNELLGMEHVRTSTGRFLARGSISDDAVLKSTGNVAKVGFGPDTVEAQVGERVSHTRDVEVTYESFEGTRSKTMSADLELTNYGTTSIITHPDLVVIPKSSPGGQHLSTVVRPELARNGRIGPLTDLVDLQSVDAWGLELEEGGVPQ